MGAAGKDSGCNSMRVGLIDVDGHNFPNIPLMKLSAYNFADHWSSYHIR